MSYQYESQRTGSLSPAQAAGLGLILWATTLAGQTQIDLRTQARKVIDFTQATRTAPVKSGAVAPATCAVGDLFYNTTASAGHNLYGCTAANTWSLLGVGFGSQKTGIGDPNGFQTCLAPSVTDRTIYFDTAAQETWQCVGSNVWRKILDTDGVGPVVAKGSFNTTDLAEPVTAGMASMQFGDSGLEYFPHNGALSRTVVPKNCTALNAGDFVSAINATGTVTCATPSAVQAVDSQMARIDSVASGNLLAAAAGGLYRVSTYVQTTNPEGAACLLDVDISYTYNGSSKTLRVVSAHNLNVDEAASQASHVIQVDDAVAIQRTLTDTCTRAAYTFDYSIVLERIR
jgi:hypothetical protein